ncbi:MAG: hypothetical protein GY947_01695 [Rhodobacteraceae bacterium]|nr:hypothetical protein [Paracoccaceae bacterium]
MKSNLTLDHKALEGAYQTRRYFAKFARIMGHLERVAEITTDEGLLKRKEAEIIKGYLAALSNTFTALSFKHLMAGRVSSHLPVSLSIDKQDSGFPIYQELLQMANDALQAERHLENSLDTEWLKKDMVRHILNEHTAPTRLQYAMSQRLYYEALAGRALFWAQNDPQAIWKGAIKGRERQRYTLHWASYDSQTNLPAIYLMDVEDSGREALPKDENRWPRAQAHLMAQAISGLKLVTIATGFDQDFDDLHPRKLRRVHLGPMYSHHFTEQSGPLREVLAEASGEEGLDWALSWTVETIWSKETKTEKTGWFSNAERQIYKLDRMGSKGGETGATEIRRSIILPERPYQVLEHRNPEGFRDVRKYVLGKNGRVLSYG